MGREIFIYGIQSMIYDIHTVYKRTRIKRCRNPEYQIIICAPQQSSHCRLSVSCPKRRLDRFSCQLEVDPKICCDKVTEVIKSMCPSDESEMPHLCIPHSSCIVIRARDDALAVRREPDRDDDIGMSTERLSLCVSASDRSRLISRSRDDALGENMMDLTTALA
ncbi:hypothetical protein L208DRAFT_190649 [Tricholoma matsutake]|nr:hypothetical protein L208DRAFT_190649 [Tricholoma matsutake 945]